MCTYTQTHTNETGTRVVLPRKSEQLRMHTDRELLSRRDVAVEINFRYALQKNLLLNKLCQSFKLQKMVHQPLKYTYFMIKAQLA